MHLTWKYQKIWNNRFFVWENCWNTYNITKLLIITSQAKNIVLKILPMNSEASKTPKGSRLILFYSSNFKKKFRQCLPKVLEHQSLFHHVLCYFPLSPFKQCCLMLSLSRVRELWRLEVAAVANSQYATLFKGGGGASGIIFVIVMLIKQSICIFSLISWGVPRTFGRHCLNFFSKNALLHEINDVYWGVFGGAELIGDVFKFIFCCYDIKTSNFY